MGLLYLYPENLSPITTASQKGSSSALNNVNITLFVHLPFAAVRVNGELLRDILLRRH
jgi:hypothetical protein